MLDFFKKLFSQKEEVLDPVCGMKIDKEKAARFLFENKDYYFCSESCQKKFEDEKRESA